MYIQLQYLKNIHKTAISVQRPGTAQHALGQLVRVATFDQQERARERDKERERARAREREKEREREISRATSKRERERENE